MGGLICSGVCVCVCVGVRACVRVCVMTVIGFRSRKTLTMPTLWSSNFFLFPKHVNKIASKAYQVGLNSRLGQFSHWF